MFEEIEYDKLVGILENKNNSKILFSIFKPFVYDAFVIKDEDCYYNLGSAFGERVIHKEEVYLNDTKKFERFILRSLDLKKYSDREQNRSSSFNLEEILTILETAKGKSATFYLLPYNHHQ